MDRMEKANALMKNAESLGVVFELNAGVVELKPVPIDEVTAIMLQDLETYLTEIRSILEKRALSVRGKELIGRRIRSSEFGDGTITDAHGDGIVAVRTQPPLDSNANPLSIAAPLKTLLILPEVSASTESRANAGEPTPNRRPWLADLMRRSRSKPAAEPRNHMNWWR